MLDIRTEYDIFNKCMNDVRSDMESRYGLLEDYLRPATEHITKANMLLLKYGFATFHECNIPCLKALLRLGERFEAREDNMTALVRKFFFHFLLQVEDSLEFEQAMFTTLTLHSHHYIDREYRSILRIVTKICTTTFDSICIKVGLDKAQCTDLIMYCCYQITNLITDLIELNKHTPNSLKRPELVPFP